MDNQKKGLDSFSLKIIAIIAMVCDHIAYALVPSDTPIFFVLRVIGRLTFPIMAFLVAEGFYHTHDVRKYMQRLLIFGAISYFPFFLLTDGASGMNVMFTLLFGTVCLYIFQNVKNKVIVCLSCILFIFISNPFDWGGIGVLYVLGFGVFRGNFKKQAICFVAITLACRIPIANNFAIGIAQGDISINSIDIVTGLFFPVFAVLALPLLKLYNGQRGKNMKWFFYAFYPAHLLVIYFIKIILR